MDRNLLTTAVGYVQRGWSVVPIPFRSKIPRRPGWEQLRLTEGDLRMCFPGGRWNVGVLLGEPSGWLVDVDLDLELAVSLADRYLPPTKAIFGRSGKPRSHWLYVSSRPVATRQWRLSTRTMIVELRATGAQTVFPSSVHESGQPIEWDVSGEPAVVDPAVLQDRLQLIADEVTALLGADVGPVKTTEPTFSRDVPASVIARARRYLAKLPPAISGQGGHDATFHAACILVGGFGLDRELALRLLQEWNERCQPPWTDRELEHKVDDALKQSGWRGYLLTQTPRTLGTHSAGAIERANRHAIEHRRRARRRTHA